MDEADMHALIRRLLWAACDENGVLMHDWGAASQIMQILKNHYSKETNAS